MKIFSRTKLAGLAAISAGCLLVSGLPAMAEGISLSAATMSATEMGGMTDADFTLSVSNTSSMPVSDLSVAFEGGMAIYVGDVAAGGSSAGVPVSMSLDTTAMPTRNFPVPVTINYIQAASVVEETSSVTVPLGAASE